MGVNCLALVHFDKDLTGFILGVGGVRLKSGDAIRMVIRIAQRVSV
jgi:hypothetical protein